MKLVVDSEMITSNLSKLNTEIESFTSSISSFSSSSVNSSVTSINTVLKSYISYISEKLNKLSNSSSEFNTLVSECISKYKDNESNTKTIEIPNISVEGLGNTQASDFYELGDRAYSGDTAARQEWIEKVAKIVQSSQYSKYGLKNSLIIAQIINESAWMRTPTTTNPDGSTLSGNNNVLGINYDMNKDISLQDSKWAKNAQATTSNVTQWDDSGNVVRSVESMRTYDCIEDCIEDYANVLYLYHPECKGSNNLEDYRSFLEGYTPNPNGSTTDNYARIISMYNLEQYDM